MAVPESIRRLVIARAAEYCEYCRMRQSWEPFHAYHVEHIVAKQHRGTDEIGNLALACHHCNLFKGPNLTSRDPDGDALVPVFHPRKVNGTIISESSPAELSASRTSGAPRYSCWK
jgi:hypothetical protein